ncbi:uncharacterized protein M6B38_115455 [Iris pallida]|uniref:Uncharacterized protein n=1 Tax=Iris pallida TaxID=29817 RepID=A0AAX6I4G9_IRIPA|nr:uncharacterized protein M6B38_115455 [Iris pallida]
MERREGITVGIQGGKLMKRSVRRKKGFAKTVADYLLSDSYMYAPLLSQEYSSLTSSPPPPRSGLDPSTAPTNNNRSSPSAATEKGRPVVQLQRLLVK